MWSLPTPLPTNAIAQPFAASCVPPPRDRLCGDSERPSRLWCLRCTRARATHCRIHTRGPHKGRAHNNHAGIAPSRPPSACCKPRRPSPVGKRNASPARKPHDPSNSGGKPALRSPARRSPTNNGTTQKRGKCRGHCTSLGFLDKALQSRTLGPTNRSRMCNVRLASKSRVHRNPPGKLGAACSHGRRIRASCTGRIERLRRCRGRHKQLGKDRASLRPLRHHSTRSPIDTHQT
mmetsp:Transcript_26164/g.55382  ORF Transcript_26164/g.55382 Transcript_26164/m.55382 type:complete len:234 (-) Transcript_26164:1070-1771(-)